MKESFHKKTDTRSTQRIRRLHADLSRICPYSVQGYQYFLLVMDDATRCMWVRFLKSKTTDKVYPMIKEIKVQIELETGQLVAFFRADNGKGEFRVMLQGFLKDLGIQLEPCPPYKHSLNRVVERAIRTVDATTRSMIYEAKMLYQIWYYTIEYAVYLKNRLPTAALPFGPQESDTGSAETLFEAYK